MFSKQATTSSTQDYIKYINKNLGLNIQYRHALTMNAAQDINVWDVSIDNYIV